MPQQQNLFPSSSSPKASTIDYPPSHRIPTWLRVIELVLFVVLRVYVGVIVLLLPWSEPWRSSTLLNHWPAISALCSNGAVRGIVSGLGLLNIWVAITETFRHRFSRS